MATIDLVQKAFAGGLRPEPQLKVSEWADKHRILPPWSAEPGQWETERTPYLKEIMDCLSVSHPAQVVVFQAGAQVGKTECGLNWLGFIIAHAPGTILLAWPSDDTIKRNVSERIDPLIEFTDTLRDLVTEKKSRSAGNNTRKKLFPGGALHIVSAQSAINLRSTPARYLFLDEVDGFPQNVGKDGDPVQLAIRRTATFQGRRKVFMCSTPSLKGESRIEAAYLESDQRVFEVPCPDCGVFAPIEWAQIEWPPGQRDLAFRRCPHCRAVQQEVQKLGMVAQGQWRATAPSDGKTVGFRVNALCSPFTTWAEIAVQHGQVHRDPVRLQEWVNNALAETFEDRSGETIAPTVIAERGERWGVHLPAGVVIQTMAVDVQGDRLEVERVGWGKGEESWSLDYQKLLGNPAAPDVWWELDKLLKQTFPHTLAVPDMSISACCIDSGGNHTGMVYNFCRDKADRNIWAVKGWSTPAKPIWPRKPSRVDKGRVPLYMVGTDTGKDAIYSRLKMGEPGPGYMHFPSDRAESYFKGLTCERVRTKWVRGRPTREWVKPDGARNEPLDLKVYNLAALHGLRALGFDLDREADQLAQFPPRDSGKPPPAPIRRSRVVARFNLD